VPAEFLHQNLDFRKRHRGPTCDMDQNVGCIREHAATIHQRVFQRPREGIVRTIIGVRFPETEQTSTARAAESGEQIIETDLN
jgi:hypothetical protein